MFIYAIPSEFKKLRVKFTKFSIQDIAGLSKSQYLPTGENEGICHFKGLRLRGDIGMSDSKSGGGIGAEAMRDHD